MFIYVAVSSNHVAELTDDTFETVLSKHDVVLVMFMVKACGSCKKFKLKMKWAADALAKTAFNVKLYTIDCQEVAQNTCKRYSVTGYPTLKVFKNGKFWKEYDGGQTNEAIKRYLIEHAMPCPAVLDTEEKLRRVSKDGNVYVAFFKKGTRGSALKDVFLQTAKELRGHARMGYCENEEMVQKYHPNHGIVFFRDQRMRNKFEPNTITYAGNETKVDLEAWIANVKHGLVGLRSPENEREFKKPLVVAYYEVDMVYNIKQTNYWRNRILKVAKEFKSFTFAVSDVYQYENEFFQFGYHHFPSIVSTPIVLARTKSKKFKMTQNFSVEALEEFVQGIKTNKLLPFVRSEKPPKVNNQVVKVVVADTFEELVERSGRDAFIMLYTSDCSVCKKVRPLWGEIGKAMDGEEVDILKMNVGKNDRPSKYKLIGLPVLYWVPKKDKKNPVRYTGHLEYYDLIEFIAKSATEELIARYRDGRVRDEL